MDCFRLRIQNLIIAASLLLGFALLLPAISHGQGACNWENICTPTPDPGATATATPDPAATATATPQPNATAPFDSQPFSAPEFGMPTGIPTANLNQQYPAPAPWDASPIAAPDAVTINPIATANYPAITLSMPVTYTVIAITEITIPISISITPAAVTGTIATTSTNTGPFSSTVYSLQSYADGIYSYTNTISGNIAALEGTNTITVLTAPAWYAPELPRPFANIGWTFEKQTGPDDAIPNFTTESFAAFTGDIIALPFSFIRMIWETLGRFGPFGLFLAWLFIMVLFVFTMEATRFFLGLFSVSVRFIVRLIELLGGWVPTGG